MHEPTDPRARALYEQAMDLTVRSIGDSNKTAALPHEQIRLMEEASRIAPDDPFISSLLANGYYRIGQFARSIEIYRSAIEKLGPDANDDPAGDLWRGLGKAYMDDKQWTFAVPAFQQQMRIHRSPECEINLGKCLIKADRPKEALDVLGADLDFDSDSLLVGGLAYRALGQPEKARELLVEASRKAPWNREVQAALEVPDTQEPHDSTSMAGPGHVEQRDVDATVAVAAGYLSRGATAEAIPRLAEWARQMPDVTILQGFLAYCYLDQCFRSWAHVPQDGVAPKGTYATTRKQVDEAKSYLDKAKSLRFNDAEIGKWLPDQRGGLSQAMKDFEREVNAAARRRFHGNPALIVAGLLWGILAVIVGLDVQERKHDPGQLLFGILYLGAPILYLVGCMVPQFVVNRKILGGESMEVRSANMIGDAATARPTGTVVVERDWLGRTVLKQEQQGGCGAALLVLFLLVLALPVIAVWNLAKNYRE